MGSRLFLLAVMVFCFLSYSHMIHAQEKDSRNKIKETYWSLLRQLHELGTRYDCYFTIEEMREELDYQRLTKELPDDYERRGGDADDPKGKIVKKWFDAFRENKKYLVSQKRVRKETKMESLEAALESLKRQVDNLHIVKSKSNPKVFHLFGKHPKVKDLREYVLDRKLKQLRYSGRLVDLPLAISHVDPQFKASSVKITHGPTNTYENMYIEIVGRSKKHNTRPEITVANVKDIVLRDVLTNHISLKIYLRVVWIATTVISKEPLTIVEFRHLREAEKEAKEIKSTKPKKSESTKQGIEQNRTGKRVLITGRPVSRQS